MGLIVEGTLRLDEVAAKVYMQDVETASTWLSRNQRYEQMRSRESMMRKALQLDGKDGRIQEEPEGEEEADAFDFTELFNDKFSSADKTARNTLFRQNFLRRMDERWVLLFEGMSMDRKMEILFDENSLEWGMLWAKYKTMAVQEFKAWLKEEQVYKLHIEEMAAIRRFELMLERRDRFELPIVTASVVIDILSLLEHYDAGIKEVSVRVVSV